MGITGWSASNYLHRASGDSIVRPYLVSYWGFRPTGVDPAEGTTFNLGAAGSGNHREGPAYAVTSGRANAQSRTNSTSEAITSTNTPENVWHHGAASFIADNSRASYLNAGGKGTNATSRIVSAFTDQYIGVRPNQANPLPSTWGVAEVSVWDTTGFTETNRDDLVTKLAAGESPVAINEEVSQPWTGLLVSYWRLLDDTDLNDYSGNAHNLTEVGTLTDFGDHPTVDDPPGGGGAFTLTADHGSFSLTGQTAGLKADRKLIAEAGMFALNGQDVVFEVTVPGDVGVFVVNGQAAQLIHGYRLIADHGSFSVSGQTAGLTAQRKLSADHATFALSGQDATLTYTPAGAATLQADHATFALSGQDATLRADRKLPSDHGAFSVSGQAAGLSVGRKLIAETGMFSLSGQDAGLRAHRVLTAAFGSYSLSGQDATLTWSGEAVIPDRDLSGRTSTGPRFSARTSTGPRYRGRTS